MSKENPYEADAAIAEPKDELDIESLKGKSPAEMVRGLAARLKALSQKPGGLSPSDLALIADQMMAQADSFDNGGEKEKPAKSSKKDDDDTPTTRTSQAATSSTPKHR